MIEELEKRVDELERTDAERTDYAIKDTTSGIAELSRVSAIQDILGELAGLHGVPCEDFQRYFGDLQNFHQQVFLDEVARRFSEAQTAMLDIRDVTGGHSGERPPKLFPE